MRDMSMRPVPDVLFRADMNGMQVYVTRRGLVYVSTRPASEERDEEEMREHLRPMKGRMSARPVRKRIDVEQEWIEMDLDGASIPPEQAVMEGERTEHSNFFLRHCPQGIYNVRSFERITFRDVYPGIDWVLYGTPGGAFKYDLVIHPGADASVIHMTYRSRKPMVSGVDGSLRSADGKGMSIAESAPFTYDQRTHVRLANAFVTERIDHHRTSVRFTLPAVDPERTRVIDPQVTWSTLLATELLDGPFSVCTTSEGNVLVTGYDGAAPGFPQGVGTGDYSGAFTVTVGSCFLRAFDANGVLLWSTLYDGAIFSQVTTDAAGHLLLVGAATNTFSTQAGINEFNGAYQSNALASGELNDGCIAVFSPAGVRLWASFLGGTQVRSIASDPSGNLLLVGTDLAEDLPVQSGSGAFSGAYYQPTNAGAEDMTLTAFAPNGSKLWCTYFGATGSDYAGHITRRADGRWFVSGYSSSSDLATQATGGLTGAYVDASYNGLGDGTLVGLGSNGALEWCTYFGGDHEDITCGITCDPQNNILITGLSASLNMPVIAGSGAFTGAYFDAAMDGGQDAFVAGFAANGAQQWSTYIGGNSLEGNGPVFNLGSVAMEQIALDTCGNIIVVFNTASTDMPVPVNNCSTTNDVTLGGMGFEDIFLMRLTPNGALNYGTYIGGSGYEFRPPFTVDRTSNTIYVTAETSDQFYANDFPLVDPGGGAYFDNTMPEPRSDDAFLMRFTPAPCDACNILMLGVEVQSASCYGVCDASVIVSAAHGTPPYTYAWNNGLTTSTGEDLCAGAYTVTVTDANGQTASITFTVDQPLSPILSIGTTPSSCNSATGTATVNTPGAGYSVLWSDGQSQNSATGLAPGSYTVAVTDPNGCVVMDTAVVVGQSAPVASAIVTTNPIIAGESTQLVGLGGTTYSWSPALGLSCTTCATPMATPGDATVYCVTVSNGSLCSDSACVRVDVLRACEVFVPNAFSPNASGKNDTQCVYGNCISTMVFAIYDRWGNKVFESYDQKTCWDGLHNGEPVNAGVYVYHLNAQLNSGETVEKSGNITLVR